MAAAGCACACSTEPAMFDGLLDMHKLHYRYDAICLSVDAFEWPNSVYGCGAPTGLLLVGWSWRVLS
jgi:hypothetical protein